MNIDQIVQSLTQKFQEPLGGEAKRHIVFWYDDEGEFKDIISDIAIDGVKVHRLTHNFLNTKLLLEVDDQESNYLLYSSIPKPENQENWLLDIYLYSSIFSADKTSILQEELGLLGSAFKQYIKEHLPFFNNQARVNKLKKLIEPSWTVDDLELGLASVICKQTHISPEEIIKTVLSESLDVEENEYLDEFTKYLSDNFFWDLVNSQFGFKGEKNNLKTLFVSLCITELSFSTSISIPSDYQRFILGTKSNVKVFFDHWFGNRSDVAKLEEILKHISTEIQLDTLLANEQPLSYIEESIFELTDQLFITYIKDSLVNQLEEYKAYKDIITKRKPKYWFSKYENYYLALGSAIALLEKHKVYKKNIPYKSMEQFFNLYVTDLYQFDQLYRHFYFHYDQTNLDLMKALQDKVEDLYRNWYLQEISALWNNCIKDNLLKHWAIPTISQQNDFYSQHVQSIVDKNDRDKVFVIISDALRYEVAEELKQEIGKVLWGDLNIEGVQGSIPSYTSLGMASLLPHKQLQIEPNGRILADGVDTTSTENRSKVLKNRYPESLAITLKDFSGLSRDEAREVIKDCRIIYLYHDRIDKIGDAGKTEDDVFKAAQETIQELITSIKFVINTLNGTHIKITSDHGFIYTRRSLDVDEKISVEKVPVLASNRRFLLTDQDVSLDGTFKFKVTQFGEQQIYAITPKGYLRYKTQGIGNKFVHGGPSLQEIVIPVISYRHLKRQSLDEGDLNRSVDVELISPSRTITNNTVALNFFQSEKVEGKRTLRELKVAFYNKDNKKISEEKLLIADSQSDNPKEREQSLVLTLKSGSYDKKENYFLKCIDKETGLIYKSPYIYQINIAIFNEFGL